MIYGFYSKEYTGLIQNAIDGSKLLCEMDYEQGAGDVKLQFTNNDGVDWNTVLDTAGGLDLLGEELQIPGSNQGNTFQFRLEIDIDSTVPDIDDFGNVVWGIHPKEAEGHQVNIFRFEDDVREDWASTGNRGIWEAKIPPGTYYYVYDYQNNMNKYNLPPDQYIVVGAGDEADAFGSKTQIRFKKSDEVYLQNLFVSFSWSKYMVTDLGTSGEEGQAKRDFSQHSNNPRIRDGRIFKGDTFIEFLGFILGKQE